VFCKWCMFFFYFHNVERASFAGLVGASRNVRTALYKNTECGKHMYFFMTRSHCCHQHVQCIQKHKQQFQFVPKNLLSASTSCNCRLQQPCSLHIHTTRMFTETCHCLPLAIYPGATDSWACYATDFTARCQCLLARATTHTYCELSMASNFHTHGVQPSYNTARLSKLVASLII